MKALACLGFSMAITVSTALLPVSTTLAADPAVAIARSEWSPVSDSSRIDQLQELLQTSYPKSTVRLLDYEEMAADEAPETWNADILVLPDAETIPLDVASSVVAFMESGGNVITFGGVLFDHLLLKTPQGFGPLSASARKMDDPHPVDAFADTSRWTAETDQTDRVLPIKAAEGPDAYNPALRIESTFAANRQYETRGLNLPSGAVPKDHDLLGLWVRADSNTPDILVELAETDGSRWIATVNTTTEWQYHTLREDDFDFWYDGSPSNRGGEGDHVRIDNAIRFKAGIARSHNTIREGDHAFEIAGLATGRWVGDTEALKRVRAPFECYRPAYKTFTIAGIDGLRPWQPDRTGNWTDWSNPPVHLTCAIPRCRGTILGGGEDWRWEPVAEAQTETGGAGTFLWRLIHADGPYKGGIWVHAGLPPDYNISDSPPLTRLLRIAIQKAWSPAVLSSAGSDKAAVFVGEHVLFGADVQPLDAPGDNAWFVSSRIVDASNTTLSMFRKQSVFVDGVAHVTSRWNPSSPKAGIYRVVTELQDESGRIVDALTSPFRILKTRKDPTAEFVRVVDGELKVGDERWVPFGINFWPRYVAGLDVAHFGRHWLHPAGYDADYVERDLTVLESLGMNMVSIQVKDAIQGRATADFLERCRQHGIRANIYVDGMHPIEHPGHNNTWQAIVDEARMAKNSAVFAWDVAWEPHFGNYDRRTRWDHAWKNWLSEQYGSPEEAEADWGVPLPRIDGKPTSPSDEQLATDGPWRVMVAAYRRFADDFISRAYGRRKRAVQEVAPEILFGCRTGWGGTGTEWAQRGMQYDLASGARHLDFISPEGWGYQPGNIWEAGIMTAYAHLVSGHKPVFWSEFGHNITLEAPADQIRWQEKTYRDFYEMMLRTGARGAAGWWFPGGYRLGENSDYGIINPDGTPRPSALTSRDFADRLKLADLYIEPEAVLEIDRDADARGMFGIREAVRDHWPKEGYAALRTAGTDTTSVNCPSLAVGNVPLTGNNPPKYLNAEFDWFMQQDAHGHWTPVENGSVIEWDGNRPLSFQTRIGNTGEAAWVAPKNANGQPGAVSLLCEFEDGTRMAFPLVEDVAPLADYTFAEFSINPPDRDSSRCTLRLEALNRTPFGQKFHITIIRE